MIDSETVVALLKAAPWWPVLVMFLAWRFGSSNLIQHGGLQAKIPGILEVQLRKTLRFDILAKG